MGEIKWWFISRVVCFLGVFVMVLATFLWDFSPLNFLESYPKSIVEKMYGIILLIWFVVFVVPTSILEISIAMDNGKGRRKMRKHVSNKLKDHSKIDEVPDFVKKTPKTEKPILRKVV